MVLENLILIIIPPKPYSEIVEILTRATRRTVEILNSESKSSPTLTVVLGAAGSGKSTVIGEFFDRQGTLYLSVDGLYNEIEKSLGTQQERYAWAINQFEALCQRAVCNRLSFILEINGDHKDQYNFVAGARQAGYIIKTIILVTGSHSINWGRVKDQKTNLGYSWTKPELGSSYAKMLRLMAGFINISNYCTVLSTANGLRHILVKLGSQEVYLLNTEDTPKWVHEYIEGPVPITWRFKQEYVGKFLKTYSHIIACVKGK